MNPGRLLEKLERNAPRIPIVPPIKIYILGLKLFLAKKDPNIIDGIETAWITGNKI